MNLDSRRTQMKWLLVLTALSLVPVYVLLGWQTSGESPQTITDWLAWFWRIEASAWGIRALVESAALIYLFQTTANTAKAGYILIAFEIALITLIALTVGMVVLTNGHKTAVAQGLPFWLYVIWSFSVAAFAPLMMGSVGFAYKCQPDDAYLVNLTTRIESLTADLESTRLELQAANEQVRAVEAWGLLTPTAQVRLIKSVANGDAPPPAKMAEALGISKQTVYRAGKDSR